MINMNNMMNLNNMNQMIYNQDNTNYNKKEMIMNLINQNNQMVNQIAINNNMIKSLLENPNSENIFEENKFDDYISNINFFPGYMGKRINVLFEYNGIQINVIAPEDVKMKELLKIFYIKFQILTRNKNYKVWELYDYIFLFNGCKISFGEEKSLIDYGLNKPVNKILFYLKDNIIGG